MGQKFPDPDSQAWFNLMHCTMYKGAEVAGDLVGPAEDNVEDESSSDDDSDTDSDNDACDDDDIEDVTETDQPPVSEVITVGHSIILSQVVFLFCSLSFSPPPCLSICLTLTLTMSLPLSPL